MSLPTIFDRGGNLAVMDPNSGELVLITEASDRALASAAREVVELTDQLKLARQALGEELKARYGVGKAEAGGYSFKVVQTPSWPLGRTQAALARLVADGVITPGEAERALPLKPSPDKVQLRALLDRLLDNPAAQVLRDARTTGAASVTEVQAVAVEEAEAA